MVGSAEFPNYNIASTSGPGILYVNSKITDAKSMPPALFAQWYEDVHIADIFATKPQGIKSAFRYETVTPGKVERPYLALYPMEDMSFLTSDAFRSIPVNDNLLPDGGPIFNFADFDTRYYSNVQHLKGEAKRAAVPSHVVTLCFDVEGDDASKAESIIKKLPLQEEAIRVSLYKNYFSRQNRLAPGEGGLKAPPKFLVVMEFNKEVDISSLKDTGVAAEYKNLKSFGEKKAFF
ncbi:hypothetical protein BT63DRAFT_425067 [Microthyrium microscopicum]|uniref:Uncharacterized protein n=1 Tax=Microthyrium microscopicum TaxID=703497 RepID=A0A6A6UAP3_9PEZI|nr:hypothetical protein BT63DRAFT_425067 [Microthyrium microscopicum]